MGTHNSCTCPWEPVHGHKPSLMEAAAHAGGAFGVDLAAKLETVARDFWLEEWLQSNPCPDPGIAIRARASLSPAGSESGSRVSSRGGSRPPSCPRSPELLSPPRSPPPDGVRSPSRAKSPGVEEGATPELAVCSSEEEVANYAKYLGMHPVLDRELLWIAECALTAPVPGGWEEYLDEDGDVFYYEASRDKSTYEHPCDAYFKWMYIALKRQSMAARKIQRFMRARRARARQERRLVRQTVRAIRLPSYTPPRRLEEV